MKKFMDNINFELLARKISTRMPVVVMMFAIVMTLVHTVKTALKYNDFTKQYQIIKEQVKTTTEKPKPDETNSLVSYSTAKVRGSELVQLENAYVLFAKQMDEAQSVKQKENLQAHLDDMASNMKAYFDDQDTSDVSIWYHGVNGQGEWVCPINYDFPDDKETQEVLLLQTNQSLSPVNAYVIADFNTKTGRFSHFQVHTTYLGLESIADDEHHLIYAGAGTPQTVNFASVPAIVWDVTIKEGLLKAPYSPVNQEFLDKVSPTSSVSSTQATQTVPDVSTTLSKQDQSVYDAYKADEALEESEYHKAQ